VQLQKITTWQAKDATGRDNDPEVEYEEFTKWESVHVDRRKCERMTYSRANARSRRSISSASCFEKYRSTMWSGKRAQSEFYSSTEKEDSDERATAKAVQWV
jgi:hypothetical protein